MTVQELSKLYLLNREIEIDRERLNELDEEIGVDEEQLIFLEEKNRSASTPNYDGMPKSPSYGNRFESGVIKVMELRDIIAHKKALRSECAMTIHAKQILCLTERNRLERYIAEQSDSLIRMILTLRFINGLTWAQVSESIGMHTTEDSVKKQCYRYLREQNDRRK